jgi:hypothetical protein
MHVTWSELSSSATFTDASDEQKNEISLGPFNGSCKKASKGELKVRAAFLASDSRHTVLMSCFMNLDVDCVSSRSL